MPVLSFHSDPKIKAKYMRRIRAHAKADEIVKGAYWEDGKGCAVGCIVETNAGPHLALAQILGGQSLEWLARLVDTLFENLPNGHAKEFPAKFLSAIPVGKDLEPVKWKFCLFLLSDNYERVKALSLTDSIKNQVLEAIAQCQKLHTDAIESGSLDESAARSAESAAESAASAARSAESAAASAAWSAESAAARSAAWSAAYIRYADKLVELLKAA